MARSVADASVVPKRFLEEEFSPQARRLRDEYAAGSEALEAPALLPYEVLNAVRQSRVYEAAELGRVARALDAFALPLHPLEGELSVATVETAHAIQLSVYDAAHVALARALDVPLYTADDRMRRASREFVEALHVREFRPSLPNAG